MASADIHWADYLLFSLSLVIPLAIGIFFLFSGGRQRTTKEYLMGDQNMNGCIVGFSMMVSTFSAITLISSPMETYYYGAIWTLISIPYIFNIILNCIFLVPFFRRFSYKSGYMYLEERYQSAVPRLLVAIAYTLLRIFTLATAIYAPSVVFNQITGLNMNLATVVCGIVCVTYTFLGGLKAVLYTDFVQTIIMLGGYVALVIVGMNDVGGIDVVWQTAKEGGRFNFATHDTDLRARHTTLNLLLGGFIATWGFYDQVTIQRIYAAKSTAAANMGMAVSIVIGVLNTISVTLAGLTIYAYYVDCDPILKYPEVTEPDQIVAHFAIEIFQDYPGLAGLFLASLFAAALSTISSMMNALSLTFVEDFVKPGYRKYTKTKMTERSTLIWAKALCLIFGCAAIGLSYTAPYMGPLLVTSSVTIGASIGSPISAVLLISIFCPYTNVVGAVGGFLSGELVGISLAVTGMVHGQDPPILDVGMCGLYPGMEEDENMTFTTYVTGMESATGISGRYRRDAGDYYGNEGALQYYSDISYAWYGTFAMATTIVVGIALSLMTMFIDAVKSDIDYLYDNELVYYKRSEKKGKDGNNFYVAQSPAVDSKPPKPECCEIKAYRSDTIMYILQ